VKLNRAVIGQKALQSLRYIFRTLRLVAKGLVTLDDKQQYAIAVRSNDHIV
jgi:hypothetical protein